MRCATVCRFRAIRDKRCVPVLLTKLKTDETSHIQRVLASSMTLYIWCVCCHSNETRVQPSYMRVRAVV